MLHLHHVNLAVPENELEAEAEFLVKGLGLDVVDPGPEFAALGARWFGFPDGVQIHLSRDAAFVPSASAHVAVQLGDDLADLEARLDANDYEYSVADFDMGFRMLFCTDPSGNRWELRGD
jgi:catechol 2,3-dioxygenase-like lactoylglutathione lyase family enzyme